MPAYATTLFRIRSADTLPPPLPRPRRRPPRPFPGENAARASTRLYARSVLKSDLSELARSLGHRAASAS